MQAEAKKLWAKTLGELPAQAPKAGIAAAGTLLFWARQLSVTAEDHRALTVHKTMCPECGALLRARVTLNRKTLAAAKRQAMLAALREEASSGRDGLLERTSADQHPEKPLADWDGGKEYYRYTPMKHVVPTLYGDRNLPDPLPADDYKIPDDAPPTVDALIRKPVGFRLVAGYNLLRDDD